MPFDIIDADDIRTRRDSTREYYQRKKRFENSNYGGSDCNNSNNDTDEYEKYPIKYEQTTIFILDAYMRDCDLPYKVTLNLLLGNNLCMLEDTGYKDWMDNLFWVVGDDYDICKQLNYMVHKIELPISGKQETKSIAIKKDYYIRINDLKLNYIFKDYSLALKIGLICSLQDFSTPLDSYGMNNTMLKVEHGEFMNSRFLDVQNRFLELKTKTRNFFYESSLLVIFRHATVINDITKMDIFDNFLLSTLDRILEKQIQPLLPSEAWQMKILLEFIKDALTISDNLIDYYNSHKDKRKIIDEKVDEGLKYLNDMSDYYFQTNAFYYGCEDFEMK